MSHPPPRARAITLRLPADWAPVEPPPRIPMVGLEAPSTRAPTQRITVMTVDEALSELGNQDAPSVRREYHQSALGTLWWVCYPGWECYAPGGERCPCGSWRAGHDPGDEDHG